MVRSLEANEEGIKVVNTRGMELGFTQSELLALIAELGETAALEQIKEALMVHLDCNVSISLALTEDYSPLRLTIRQL